MAAKKQVAQATISPGQVEAQVALGFLLFQRLVADGATSATLDVTIPRNAVVDSFDLVVEAGRAVSTIVKNVAQVRSSPTPPAGGGASVIVDFGALRTVSGLSAPDGTLISRVAAWAGTQFAEMPVFGGRTATSPVFFGSEIRTERLLVDLTVGMAESKLAEEMQVVLPEAPSGLELRVSGGTPFWTHPAAVTPGADAAISPDAWNRDAKRRVSAALALAALTGEPTSREALQLQFVLTSRSPGKLSLEVHPEHQDQKSLRFVRRVTFGSEFSTPLEFSEEGAQEIAVETQPPPAAGQTRDAREIRLTVEADLPPERVIPPVGPEPADLADIVLTPDRAALVRLPRGAGLTELTALRVPVAAGPDGAEMAAVLWANRAEDAVEPLETLPGGSSETVTLKARDTEAWVTFTFKEAMSLDEANLPWAALVVTRGSVSWALGASSGTDDALDPSVVRSGPVGGPWHNLPGPLTSGQPGLGRSRGRVRMVGRAAPEAPVAPVLLAVSGGPETGEFEVTPTKNGVTVVLTPDQALDEQAATLRITSRTPGRIVLRNIDVVSGS